MEINRAHGFKDILINTLGGRIIIIGTALACLDLGYRLLYSNYVEKPEPIQQRDVFGDSKPEIFIERDRVRYYSHVDGKEISDYFK